MKIVVVGDGKVGFTITKNLAAEGHDITIIENKPTVLSNTLNLLDVVGIQGNGASLDVQLNAGVDQADLVIATTSTDELNIACCLIAKRLGAKSTIARIRNPEYVKSMNLIKDDLGLSMFINPEKAAARQIARALTFPEAIKVNSFAKGRLTLVEVKVPDNSALANLQVKQFDHGLVNNILICTLARNNEVIIPNGNTIIQSGDKISIVGKNKDIRRFLRFMGLKNQIIRNVMISGGGKIAFYLATSLLDVGCDITIVENNAQRALELVQHFPDANIINGDGTDQELLLSEDLEHQDAFIALTGNDEENVMMSMFATSVGVKKVIPKVNRMTLGFILEKIGLDSTITPKNICADQIIEYVRAIQNSVGSSVESMMHLQDGAVEVLEFRVKDSCSFLNKPFKDIKFKQGILVASITHRGEVILANGNSRINIGDSVLIFSQIPGLGELNDVIQS